MSMWFSNQPPRWHITWLGNTKMRYVGQLGDRDIYMNPHGLLLGVHATLPAKRIQGRRPAALRHKVNAMRALLVQQ